MEVSKVSKELLKKQQEELLHKDEIIYSDDRDSRVKDSGEVFTPFALIKKMINELDYDFDNPDHTKTWLDPTCGTGNFLVWLAAMGVDPKNIYGVDIMPDNIKIARERLTEIYLEQDYDIMYLNEWFDKHLVVADALTYSYDFEHEDSMDAW